MWKSPLISRAKYYKTTTHLSFIFQGNLATGETRTFAVEAASSDPQLTEKSMEDNRAHAIIDPLNFRLGDIIISISL